ncbi:hypothetical protein QQM79_19275 [Marinobacteraceae bacterium S3BR75-40.1]
MQSDIEIYIRDVDIEALKQWLEQRFDAVDLSPLDNNAGYKGAVVSGDHRVPVSLFFRAGGNRYSSLTFDSSHTPWETDLACAREAFEALGTEIRCSTGEWQEGMPEENEYWWRIDARGEKKARWN